ncbi:MAG: hypothetical protein AAFQ66_02220 [Pseudomonadota bacterium]
MNKKPDAALVALARIDAAIASGDLADDVIEKVQLYRTKLITPVRVSVLGLSAVGKSTVLNFLAGDEVIPAGIPLPTLQLRWGDSARCISILPDGTKQTRDDFHAEVVATEDPVFVEIELPLPALRKISIMEVVMGTEVAEQKRALSWAADRSDIAVWCTQEFDVLEQYLWSVMPDRLKDHGVLAVTKADELTSQGVLNERIKQFENETDAEFLDIMPLSTTEAIAARGEDGSVDKARLDASGGRKLIRAMLRQVQQGQQAAIDAFDLLLVKSGLDPRDYNTELIPDEPPRPARSKISQPAPKVEKQAKPKAKVRVAKRVTKSALLNEQPAPKHIPASSDETGQTPAAAPAKPKRRPRVSVRRSADIIDIQGEKAQGKRAKRQKATTDPVTEPVGPSSVDEFLFVEKGGQPAKETAKAPAPDAPNVSDEAKNFYTKAVTYLRDQATQILEENQKLNGKAAPVVMDRCLEAADWLTDQLTHIGEDDPDISDAMETALDAADLMQLLHIEGADSSTEEAITVLTQVKREFESRIS